MASPAVSYGNFWAIYHRPFHQKRSVGQAKMVKKVSLPVMVALGLGKGKEGTGVILGANMTDPFPYIGDRETTAYIADHTVAVTVGTFAESCVLFIGCQASGSTLSSNTVWLSEVAVCTALAMARITMDYHHDSLRFD